MDIHVCLIAYMSHIEYASVLICNTFNDTISYMLGHSYIVLLIYAIVYVCVRSYAFLVIYHNVYMRVYAHIPWVYAHGGYHDINYMHRLRV